MYFPKKYEIFKLRQLGKKVTYLTNKTQAVVSLIKNKIVIFDLGFS